jgi:3-dehydroquinate synthase
MRERVRVEVGRPYDVVVGSGLLADAKALIAEAIGERRTIVVSDERVAPLYLDRLGIDAAVVLPPGERTKSWEGYRRLCEELLALGIDRKTVLVVLGGGVVGDLAGFAAATLLRGIDFVQIPTTLLAQVDSSVGGKTAIDTAAGKNLVGAVHQPVLVLADIDVLASLPLRELRAGYAEIVKYGFIRDPGFFEWLERHGGALLAGDVGARRHAVVESCRAKAAVVAADERETGDRALLNFGHTFGHALEAELGFSDALLHGEAVSIGMAQAFDLSVRLGLCSGQDATRARAHLDALGLPTRPPAGLDPARLVGHMKKDKKAAGGRLAFILTRGIGEAFVARDVPEAEVLAFLAGAAQSPSPRSAERGET